MDTPIIKYTPQPIDEYIVVVNLSEDWETVHNYIINENEIDGIPNRKVNCSNTQSFSLRTAIYEMSVAEADILRTHEKVESVELNPDKYPQPQSINVVRYRKNVAFNKPILPANVGNESIAYTNGVRSNWSMLFVTDPSSQPFQGVGITTTDTVNRDVSYSLSGKNVDAVTIDSGMGVLHPEFIADDGTYRVFDVILDGPYKVDPDFFEEPDTDRLDTVTIDGVDIGIRPVESVARAWWASAANRSAAFASIGAVSIPSTYTFEQAFSKNASSNPILNTHGTSCGSQIGGKSFGLAFECNLWNIRILLTGDGGVIGGVTALNVCTAWHKAKKIQSSDPDPTLLNNSWGSNSSTGNVNNITYYHTYRGTDTSYTGNASDGGLEVPSGAGACRNHTAATLNYNNGTTQAIVSSSDGEYQNTSSTTNSAAENAIAAGCIVTASAGNTNQKLSDKDDVDFNNKYHGTISHGTPGITTSYINRVGGVQQGFADGTDEVNHVPGNGSIRVGALDCAVEPDGEKQGSTKFSLRKVHYSANGPMVDIFAPAEMSMAAAYASDEDYQREDNSNFYDAWFGGTSSACPNTCSLISLYLQSNRGATQSSVRDWLKTVGSKSGLMSDPYPGVDDTGYWSLDFNFSTDFPDKNNQSYNLRGDGNLRGAPNRVLFNPFANDTVRSISGVSISGVSITNS